MKRDMDLLRELMLRLEALPLRPGSIVTIEPPFEGTGFDVPGHSDDAIEYHLDYIARSGLIDSGSMRPMRGIGFRYLTLAGHDFVDAVRDPETWKNTKKAAAGAGGFTLDLLKDLAKGFIKKQVKDRTGIEI